jgi:hypothetical protein
MNKKSKRAARPTQQASVHPETQPPEERRVPDANNSKRAHGQQQDARTGHDKDANEQQARARQARS